MKQTLILAIIVNFIISFESLILADELKIFRVKLIEKVEVKTKDKDGRETTKVIEKVNNATITLPVLIRPGSKGKYKQDGNHDKGSIKVTRVLVDPKNNRINAEARFKSDGLSGPCGKVTLSFSEFSGFVEGSWFCKGEPDRHGEIKALDN